MMKLGAFEFGIKQNLGIQSPLQPGQSTKPVFVLGKGRKVLVKSPGEQYPFRIPRKASNTPITIRLASPNPSNHQKIFEETFGKLVDSSPKVKFVPIKGEVDFGNVHYKFALYTPQGITATLEKVPKSWTVAVPPMEFQAAPDKKLIMCILRDNVGYEWVLTE
jgi:hypothetical protein